MWGLCKQHILRHLFQLSSEFLAVHANRNQETIDATRVGSSNVMIQGITRQYVQLCPLAIPTRPRTGLKVFLMRLAKKISHDIIPCFIAFRKPGYSPIRWAWIKSGFGTGDRNRVGTIR
jgi:hypothetical protein